MGATGGDSSGPGGGMVKNARCLIIKCCNLMACHTSIVAKSCVLVIFDVVLQAATSECLGVIVRVLPVMHFCLRLFCSSLSIKKSSDL